MKKKELKVLPNHLGIYIRVSTEKQKTEGLSSKNQLDKGITKANNLGWTYSVYDDSGLSGSISWFDRPGIRKLMIDIEEGRVGGLFSIDIDRWSRDSDYIEPQVIITKFKESGIKIFTQTGEYDFSDPSVELSSRIKGVFASYERIQTKLRVKMNVEKSMLNGNNAGGGLLAYGYDRENKKLIVNTKESKVVKMIYDLYLEGKGTQTIAGILNEKKIPTKRNNVGNDMAIKRTIKKANGEYEIEKITKKGDEFVWRDTVVYNILKNPIYIGKKKFKEHTIPSPQIIEVEKYDAVQVFLKEKMRFKREPYTNVGKQVNQFLLKGLIRCGKCGRSFFGHKRKDLKDKAYKCLSHRYKSEWCGNRGIDIDYTEKVIWESLSGLEKELIHMIDTQSSHSYMDKELIGISQNLIEKNTKHILNLERRYNEGEIKKDRYSSLLNEYESEIKLAEEKIKAIKDSNYIIENRDTYLKVVNEFGKTINRAKTFQEKQLIVRAFIDSITITTDNEHKCQNIIVNYKMDKFSFLRLKGDIAVRYKSNWIRLINESSPIKWGGITEKNDDGSDPQFVLNITA